MPAGDGLAAVLARARDRGFLGPGDVADHVAHAQAFVAALAAPPPNLLDLGSGGGVPGLVLADAWPGCQVTLLDAQARRTAFLLDAVGRLGWRERVTVVTGRAEQVGRDPQHRGRYAVVTARSFGPPAVAAECGAPFLSPGGVLLVAEPPDAPDDRWPEDGLARIGLADDGVVRAGGGTVRRLRADRPVPDDLPRRDGVPARNPLF